MNAVLFVVLSSCVLYGLCGGHGDGDDFKSLLSPRADTRLFGDAIDYKFPLTRDIPINPNDDKATLLAKAAQLKEIATQYTLINHVADLRSTDFRAFTSNLNFEVIDIAEKRGRISLEVSELRQKIDHLTTAKDYQTKEINLINTETHDIKLRIVELQKLVWRLGKKSDTLVRLIDDYRFNIDHMNKKQDSMREYSDALLLKSDKLNLYSLELAEYINYINTEASVFARDKTQGTVLTDYFNQQATKFTNAANKL
jgi:chromosome segregation ATPase